MEIGHILDKRFKMKYFIYRNLHTKTFSARYNGLVIDHPEIFIARNVSFKVNEGGRIRVVKERRKNVHAFVVAEKYNRLSLNNKAAKYLRANVTKMIEVTYNPYTCKSFVVKETGAEIFEANFVVGLDNRIFISRFRK